ncbi:MAG: HAMP domain-containing protein [Rhodospirillales bacterium]|nr:HAMP domain-containing protein [Rhodospirillales bacterium]
MSSSPTDVGLVRFASPRLSLKRLVPSTLLGRSVLIIVMPLILVQVVATWVFYDRHWDTVSRRLANSVAGEIAVVIDVLDRTETDLDRYRLFATMSSATEIDFRLRPGARLEGSEPEDETPIVVSMRELVGRPFTIGPGEDPKDVLISVQLDDGVLDAATPRKRLTTYTTNLVIIWMIGSSIIFFCVAILFMRNQIRALRRLAAAADAFGKGRSPPDFKLEGATEIRQAGAAFMAMRDRIQRQITQRTEMLAGVSHDLRTPLTRMKLALAFDEVPVEELRADVAEMERMVQGYLDFARGEGAEDQVETDIGLLLEEVAADARRDGASLLLTAPEDCVLSVRPHALKRCITNLVGNALRHGRHVWLSAVAMPDHVDVLVDDDGPGIPPEQREAVFRPFFRLDPSRNPATGGVGLGLTIARDVARGHGGDLLLETSPQGGLRARIHLPR